MKAIIDSVKVQRRARASHAASLGGLLTMLAGVALPLWRPALATPAAVLIATGFAAASVGIFFANRWVKKPRPEQALDQALKGLDDRCRLYHYLNRGSDHLLLMPGGLVVLETRAGEGVFEYRDGRWHQKITLGKALRYFVEEMLGDPIADARRAAARLSNAAERSLPQPASVPVVSIVVFTHPAAVLHHEGAPIPVCQPKQLRERLPKFSPPLPQTVYESLRAALDAGGL